jgi:hypothetical protein
MKTAMTELIEYIELNIDDNDFIKHEILEQADKLLEKEKEQLINAHTNAYLIGEDDISVDDANEASIKYYNQIYNQ